MRRLPQTDLRYTVTKPVEIRRGKSSNTTQAVDEVRRLTSGVRQLTTNVQQARPCNFN